MGMTTEPVTRATPPGRRISRLAVPGNYVALTFDDGPSAANTPRVLDILRSHGAHGTFFVVGESVNRNAGILSRAVSEGNEIGVHTWSHIKMTGSSAERISSEVSPQHRRHHRRHRTRPAPHPPALWRHQRLHRQLHV